MSGLTLLLTVVAAVILGLFISYFLSSSDDSHTPTHDHEDVDPEVDYDAVSVTSYIKPLRPLTLASTKNCHVIKAYS